MKNNYMESRNKDLKEYFNILEPEFPIWLNDYINTKEMLKQQYISITCGTIYSDLFESEFFFSSLDHAIAVALIIWHFTKDKKQTLSGLFHDIATPVFKHCVDFMNKDYITQESTEDLTTQIIENSEEIMTLLQRDKIKLNEIDNYHLYPIADNDTPQLSSDRLEYSLSNALFTYKLSDIEKIKEIHKILLENIRDDNGKFKKIKNIVLGASFTPTPPYMVIESLGNWIENLEFALKEANSKEEKIDAIMESHLRFEHIHPFSDGNGRVGRALIVLYCLKESIPPVVIEKGQRERYIAALNNEDKKELKLLGIELSEKEKFRQKLIKDMIREKRSGEIER